jgi:hypothetical protein
VIKDALPKADILHNSANSHLQGTKPEQKGESEEQTTIHLLPHQPMELSVYFLHPNALPVDPILDTSGWDGEKRVVPMQDKCFVMNTVRGRSLFATA